MAHVAIKLPGAMFDCKENVSIDEGLEMVSFKAWLVATGIFSCWSERTGIAQGT